MSRLINFGEAKHKPQHPESTRHRQTWGAKQLAAGVSPEMSRLNIGIE
jgi:O-acetylhomoserine (thiol)-lyase